MIDDIAQSIMYAKQHMYEYKDNAGKQLPRVLSGHTSSCKNTNDKKKMEN